MEVLLFVATVSLWFVDNTEGESVFNKPDFGSLVASFNGNGCPEGAKKDAMYKGYYRYLEGSQKNSSILYVGAMNNLYKLELPSLACKKNMESIPNSETQRRCRIQGKSDTPDCQNHIRVVMEMPDNLLVCGTGAYSPKRYNLNDNLEVNTTDTGVAMCPFDPMDNYTAILVTEGNPCNATVPYFGTYTDFIKSQPVLYRQAFQCPDSGKTYSEKTTDREDNIWFNSPQFVGSFDDLEKVMFFFREISVEHPTLKNKVYSRVGKVCKQDLGGGYMDVTKKKWLSFQKARLVCSVPGSVPYYYDDIYDVYESGNQFYALFYRHTGVDSSASKYSHIVASSAICVYEKDAIEEVFRGKFQYKSPQDKWETLPDYQNPNPRLDNCSAHRDNPDIFKDKVSQYQLMAEVIEPAYGQPIFYKTGVQFINIAVSETETSSTSSQITGRNIYLASNKGEIYDVFFKTFDPKNYLTSKSPTVYRPFGSERDTKYSVWDMKYLNGSLLLGTDFKVTRLDVWNMCSKIQKIDICIMNTKCKWSKCSESCIRANYAEKACAQPYLDWTTIGAEGVLESLKDEIDNNTVVLPAVEGLYTTLPLNAKVHVDYVIWRKSLDCSGNSVLDEDQEKYAVTASGDLIIKNITIADNWANFTACSGIKLKGYRVTVASDEEQIIEVWKQQFNDWSSAFTRWKHCAESYFDQCPRPNS